MWCARAHQAHEVQKAVKIGALGQTLICNYPAQHVTELAFEHGEDLLHDVRILARKIDRVEILLDCGIRWVGRPTLAAFLVEYVNLVIRRARNGEPGQVKPGEVMTPLDPLDHIWLLAPTLLLGHRDPL